MKSVLLAMLLCCFAQNALANMAPFDPNDPRYSKRRGDEAAPANPPEESNPQPSEKEKSKKKQKVKEENSQDVDPK